MERNYKSCVVKNTRKYWTGVTFDHFIRIFMV